MRRYRKRWRGGHVGKKESRGLFPGFRKLKYFQRFEVWKTALEYAFLLSREVVIVANEKNLKKLSPKEAREYGAKGGKASGESRRRRKSLRESMNALLEMPISNQRDFNKAIKLGYLPEDTDNSIMIVIALYERAKTGDVAAIKELRGLIGEDSSKDEGQLEELIKGLQDV